MVMAVNSGFIELLYSVYKLFIFGYYHPMFPRAYDTIGINGGCWWSCYMYKAAASTVSRVSHSDFLVKSIKGISS